MAPPRKAPGVRGRIPSVPGRGRGQSRAEVPSSDSSPSSSDTTPSLPNTPDTEVGAASVPPAQTNIPPSQDAQNLESPELPMPNLDGIGTGQNQSLIDTIKHRVKQLNQRLTQMSGHLFDTDTQVTAINAVLREQGQTIAVLTNAVPAIQEGIADLRTSIQNDVNTRLRASEQTFDTALAAYRRETTAALTNHTTEQRRTIRELTGQMTELLPGKKFRLVQCWCRAKNSGWYNILAAQRTRHGLILMPILICNILPVHNDNIDRQYYTNVLPVHNLNIHPIFNQCSTSTQLKYWHNRNVLALGSSSYIGNGPGRCATPIWSQ